jgi:hypothetical protein
VTVAVAADTRYLMHVNDPLVDPKSQKGGKSKHFILTLVERAVIENGKKGQTRKGYEYSVQSGHTKLKVTEPHDAVCIHESESVVLPTLERKPAYQTPGTMLPRASLPLTHVILGSHDPHRTGVSDQGDCDYVQSRPEGLGTAV